MLFSSSVKLNLSSSIEQVKQILLRDIAREIECERRVAEYKKQSQLATLDVLSGKTPEIVPYILRPFNQQIQE